MGRIITVTGGAKSGKSVVAEELCRRRNNSTGYIATSIPFDDDMKDKVKKHVERRPKEWKTYEIYKDVHKFINEISKECETVMLDCVTLMINNLMFEFCENPDEMDADRIGEMEDYILSQFKELIEEIKKTELYFIFVTNETGMGVIPANRLSRIYSNIAGKINQFLTSESDDVYLTVSGIPLRIKADGKVRDLYE